MAQLDALNLVRQLRQRLVDFGLDNNFVRDSSLTQILRQIWEGAPDQGGLVSELWVQAAFPSRPSRISLESLVQNGKFNSWMAHQLVKAGAMPLSRPLYDHQAQSLELATHEPPESGMPAILVTAGTGAGKTESFLLPMLNLLATEERNPKSTGMRCLILYPMNALVNDQVDRLYAWLKGQDKLRLFHFTSETPENVKAAENDNVPIWDRCRLRTRQQARGIEDEFGKRIDSGTRAFPPDIVITNYSMLEYMLCRPQDSVFFGDALRCVILDEAHLYTGALAGEITLLLRRLLDRCGLSSSQVVHLATSATMGGSDDELKKFTSTLFSKRMDLVRLVSGKSIRTIPDGAESPPVAAPRPKQIADAQWLTEATIRLDEDGRVQLAESVTQCDALIEPLCLLTTRESVLAARQRAKDQPARMLYQSLAAAPLVRRLETILWEQPRLPLASLSAELWGRDELVSEAATVELLRLSAAARQSIDEQPLVPHRLHVLTRLPSEMRACLNPDCTGPEDLRWAGLGIVAEAAAEKCPYCQALTLEIKRCENCGEVSLEAWQSGAALAGSCPTHSAVSSQKPEDPERLHLWPERRATEVQHGELRLSAVKVNPASGELRGAKAAGVPLRRLDDCPNCGADSSTWTKTGGSSSVGLPIVAETILAELPEFPSPDRSWLPGRGRRLLTFSDSRREAAKLGPQLSQQHERRLIRAAWVRCALESPPADDALIGDLQSDIKSLHQRLNTEILSDAQRRRLVDQLEIAERDLVAATSGGRLSDWAVNVGQSKLVLELLDRESAEHHRHDQWSQHKFEENAKRVRKALELRLMNELVRPFRGSSSPEDIGLLEVSYPGLDAIPAPSSFIGRLPTPAIRSVMTNAWPDFLAALCDTLREQGVVTLGDDELDDAYGVDHVGRIGLWCSQQDALEYRLVRFVGETERQTRRRFAKAVLTQIAISSEDVSQLADELLTAAFTSLLEVAQRSEYPWLEYASDRQSASRGAVSGLRIKFPELSIRRPRQLFLCPRTGWVWPRSVVGCAPRDGCTDLRPTSDAELDGISRFFRERREYRLSKVFETAVWAEEHSAQLSPGENRRLQDLFKAGIRNILSSTTTLELGIDIGGLNAVLLSNVPPSNVNYMQRGGRAGRRADGSSIVVTFSRNRGFDRDVFSHMGQYLGRAIRRPDVLLNRKRLVERHIHAMLLGEFFQQVRSPSSHVGAMRAYGLMGRFCARPLPPYWDSASRPELVTERFSAHDFAEPKWWSSRANSLAEQFRFFLEWAAGPDGGQLQQRVSQLLSATPFALMASATDWPTLIARVNDRYNDALLQWCATYESLLVAWQNTDDSTGNARRQANALRYQAMAFHEMTVIEALADEQFLPRYGFPIGLLRLRVLTVSESDQPNAKVYAREEDQYRLERPGLLAMREYVPGARFFVGNKVVTSHGLLKHWSGADINTAIGFRGQIAECSNGHRYYSFNSDLGPCPVCGAADHKSEVKPLLFPRFGFSTAAWDRPQFRGSPSAPIGRPEVITIATRNEGRPDFGGLKGVMARYQEDGELLVVNSGSGGRGFAVCLNCGYSESELAVFKSGPDELPKTYEHHAPLQFAPTKHGRGWVDCRKHNGKHDLRRQMLTARQVTDIAIIEVPQLINADLAVATTLAHALRIAGTQLLSIDSREIGSFVMTTDAGPNCGLVLFDTMPGGAGHVGELLESASEWIDKSADVLFGNQAHHERCISACLDCLLSYETQFDHDLGLLTRATAWDFLNHLRTNEKWTAVNAEGPNQALASHPVSRASTDADRLEKARRKRKS